MTIIEMAQTANDILEHSKKKVDLSMANEVTSTAQRREETYAMTDEEFSDRVLMMEQCGMTREEICDELGIPYYISKNHRNAQPYQREEGESIRALLFLVACLFVLLGFYCGFSLIG